MGYKYPKIQLDDYEELWLEEVYNHFIEKAEVVDELYLLVNLYDKLPKGFTPSTIDNRLLLFNQITILGVLHVDPDSDLPEKCDKVIRQIREIILSNPEVDQIMTDELEERTGFSQQELDQIMFMFKQFRNLRRGSSLDTKTGHYLSISVGDTEVKKEYLYYSNFQNIIDVFEETHRHDPKTETESTTGYTDFDTQNILSSTEYHPVFRSRVEKVDKKLAFVLMPFNEEWSDRVYSKLIKNTVESMGLQCLRADNLTGQIVMEDIWVKINQSGLIIADVTNKNPNVLYELGIVHAIGKPTILLSQNLEDIPFDFKHLRHFEYNDNVEGIQNFEEKISNVITEIYHQVYNISL